MIDCSHANSGKDHQRQYLVGEDVAAYIARGESRIVGVMLESNLVAGRQNLTSPQALVYGQSITDACMGWEETVSLCHRLAEATSTRMAERGDTIPQPKVSA